MTGTNPVECFCSSAFNGRAKPDERRACAASLTHNREMFRVAERPRRAASPALAQRASRTLPPELGFLAVYTHVNICSSNAWQMGIVMQVVKLRYQERGLRPRRTK